MKNQLKVQMFGTSFTIQANEDTEQLQKILHYLEQKIKEVKQKLPNADPIKLTIIAALNIVDELFKARTNNYEQLSEQDTGEIEKITQNIINKLDDALLEK